MLFLTFPSIAGNTIPHTHPRIAQYYEALTNAWRDRWEGDLFRQACQAAEVAWQSSGIFPPWHAQLSHTITYGDDDYLSIYSHVQESLPGQPPFQVASSCTWTLADGLPCPYTTFLPLSLSRIRNQIFTLVQTTQKEESSLLFPNAHFLAKKNFSPQRFYLSDTHMHFFYPMGVLGSRSEGIPTFSLPRCPAN